MLMFGLWKMTILFEFSHCFSEKNVRIFSVVDVTVDQ